MRLLLSLNIGNGIVVTILVVASLLMLGYLASGRMPVRRSDESAPSKRLLLRRWHIGLVLSALGGVVAAVATIVICEVVLDLFGAPIENDTRAWVVVSLAAVGVAVFNIWKSRRRRKIIAGAAVLLFLLTGTLAINASYGFNPTIASLLNIDLGHPLSIPKRTPAPTPTGTTTPEPVTPLWQTWTPPSGMPAAGEYGTVRIPNTASGFVARPAYLYLPPAALVPNPPALPILIMMMGQPGGPDSSIKFLPTLTSMAAANKGLGAIVLTIDQIGNPVQNPLCIDSARGNVHTYVMTDVLNYVRKNLHVAAGKQNWAIGGYSNGGECALSFGAQYPDVFGSILDVSGELAPSLGTPQGTLRLGFGGSQSRFDAEKPLLIIAKTRYTDMLAIFTCGSSDYFYGPVCAQAAAVGTAAGMTTRQFMGQGVGHRSDAIVFGVKAGYPTLYARWGLSAP